MVRLNNGSAFTNKVCKNRFCFHIDGSEKIFLFISHLDLSGYHMILVVGDVIYLIRFYCSSCKYLGELILHYNLISHISVMVRTA